MQAATSADPRNSWVEQPWEKRRYASGGWGIVHWDTTGEAHHVAVEVDPGTIDVLLAAPIFYEAGRAERDVATHLLDHTNCPQYTLTGSAVGCQVFITLQTRAQGLRESAMAVAEGRSRTPDKPEISDPRLEPPKPVDPATRAFQTGRIFQVEGGAAGRKAIVDEFFRETSATVDEITEEIRDHEDAEAERNFDEAHDPYADRCAGCGVAPGELHKRSCPELHAREDAANEQGVRLTDADRIHHAPQQPAPSDYDLVTSLEGRSPTPLERIEIDKHGVAGRPITVAERGDHATTFSAGQWEYLRDTAKRASTAGIAARLGNVLWLVTPNGEHYEMGPIDEHAEGRCSECHALPGYIHMEGCSQAWR